MDILNSCSISDYRSKTLEKTKLIFPFYDEKTEGQRYDLCSPKSHEKLNGKARFRV